jgi:CRP/FNR family cyclic AMP-dependent transcriptional regulator
MRLPDHVLSALPDDSILKEIDSADFDALLSLAVPRRFRRGQTVFEEGDTGDSMMIVLSGRLKVSVVSAQGRETVLDYIGPGGIAGEVAVLDGGPRTATLTALESTEVVLLLRRDLFPYLARHTDVALRVIRTLCRRLRRTNVLVHDHATLAMAPRLARGLMRLLALHGEQNGEAIRLRMNQGELGGYVSLSRENVNRQLREWASEGIVALGRGSVMVLAPQTLARIAEE